MCGGGGRCTCCKKCEDGYSCVLDSFSVHEGVLDAAKGLGFMGRFM